MWICRKLINLSVQHLIEINIKNKKMNYTTYRLHIGVIRTLEGVETELPVSFSVKSDNVLIYHRSARSLCVVYVMKCTIGEL